MGNHEVVITGIGLVSSLGEGVDANWNALTAVNPVPIVDSTRFQPIAVHPLPEIDWSSQIPRKGDLRQMDVWQRLGVHTAGLALDDAGLKDDTELCGTMDMTVSAGGGARDISVDDAILSAAASADDPEINRILTTELRPTLFLAQLSNLLAGNISIVHKVTGSSRTFMGEEGGSISALEYAVARIRAGQSTHALVGGAHFCETPDFLLLHALGGLLHEGEWTPLWQRLSAPGGGMIEGSGAAFLVLEQREHAEARGARIHAAISKVHSGQARRDGAYGDELARLFETAGAGEADLVLSAASGADAPTIAELQTMQRIGKPFRGISAMTGHLKEAQLPFAVALAAIAASRGEAPSPFSADAEKALAGEVRTVLATAVGMACAEGAALVTAAR